MAKESRQKQKLLYVQKILLERTDDTHGITVGEIIDILSQYGISAERKSIYDDIHTLEGFGLDICTKKSKTVTYYIGNRDFEMPELKLLVDAVQSSKFITRKKSMELIKKVESLASVHDGALLQRQVYVTNRVKTDNEKIYYNVDKIHNAINCDKQITFLYSEWTVDFGGAKKVTKKYRKNGESYEVSPLALVWDDENYYLVAKEQKSGEVKHYRVDKMEKIEISQQKRTEAQYSFDTALYSKSVFGMFGGDVVQMKFKVANSLIGVLADRFGADIFVSKADENSFFVTLEVVPSKQFYGWLCGLGSKVEIIEPKSERESFERYIAEISDLYKRQD